MDQQQGPKRSSVRDNVQYVLMLVGTACFFTFEKTVSSAHRVDLYFAHRVNLHFTLRVGKFHQFVAESRSDFFLTEHICYIRGIFHRVHRVNHCMFYVVYVHVINVYFVNICNYFYVYVCVLYIYFVNILLLFLSDTFLGHQNL